MLTSLLKVCRVSRCSCYEVSDVEVLQTCNCTVLIDGRQVSTIRTLPYALDLLGLGHALVSGYRPESVHVFQASETDFVVNVLTLGRLEMPTHRLTTAKISCKLIEDLYARYYHENRAIHRAVAVTATGDYICDVEDVTTLSLVYKLIGALYRLKRTLQELIIVLTCNVDESILQALSILQVIGVLTTGYVTYDAALFARKSGIVLAGNYNPEDRSFTLYSWSPVLVESSYCKEH